MIIRLTLLLAAGIGGSMLILGTEQRGVSQDAIVASVLNPETAPVSDDAAVPVPFVIQASMDSASPEPAVIEAAVATALDGDVDDRSTGVEVTRDAGLDLTSVQLTSTSVEQPAEAAAVAAEPQILFVTGSRVNLRSGPSTARAIVGRLVRGTEAELLDKSADGWMQIRDVATGTEGFMSSQFLSPVNPG